MNRGRGRKKEKGKGEEKGNEFKEQGSGETKRSEEIACTHLCFYTVKF